MNAPRPSNQIKVRLIPQKNTLARAPTCETQICSEARARGFGGAKVLESEKKQASKIYIGISKMGSEKSFVFVIFLSLVFQSRSTFHIIPRLQKDQHKQ
jgi:hypothetical protein